MRACISCGRRASRRCAAGAEWRGHVPAAVQLARLPQGYVLLCSCPGSIAHYYSQRCSSSRSSVSCVGRLGAAPSAATPRQGLQLQRVHIPCQHARELTVREPRTLRNGTHATQAIRAACLAACHPHPLLRGAALLVARARSPRRLAACNGQALLISTQAALSDARSNTSTIVSINNVTADECARGRVHVQMYICSMRPGRKPRAGTC